MATLDQILNELLEIKQILADNGLVKADRCENCENKINQHCYFCKVQYCEYCSNNFLQTDANCNYIIICKKCKKHENHIFKPYKCNGCQKIKCTICDGCNGSNINGNFACNDCY